MRKKIQPKTFGPPQIVSPKLTPEEEQQFDYDICCCIEELEMILSRSPTEKQRRLAEVSLKILKNPAETFIKKKQVMRQQFGDYKKKFEGKKKEVISSLKSNKVLFKCSEPPSNSVFVRKHSRKINDSGNLELNSADVELTHSTVKIKNLHMNEENTVQLVSDNSFRFNF